MAYLQKKSVKKPGLKTCPEKINTSKELSSLNVWGLQRYYRKLKRGEGEKPQKEIISNVMTMIFIKNWNE